MKTRKLALLILTFIIMNIFYSCASIPKGAVAVQPFVKDKYLGKWYEIARFDFKFERNLNNTTAEYSLKENGAIKRIKIGSSQHVFEIFQGLIEDINHEEFWILLLNRANKVLGKERISHGGISGTVADSKIIFKVALDKMASSIILIHNHPSGNLKPSGPDISLTKKIKEAGQILEISVLDHLIIAENSYYSFADDGKI